MDNVLIISEDGSIVISCDDTYSGEIVIPEGVISLRYHAFRNDINLKSVSLPSSVESIGQETFRGCLGLSYIKIGIKVREIGEGAFAETNVYIDVDEDNPNYSSINGSLFDKRKSKLLHYFCSSPICGDDLPNTIETIGNWAFSGINLLRIVKLPSTIRFIGYKAFCNCANLKEIYLPQDLIRFYHSHWYNPSEDWDASYTFENCYALEKVVINDKLKTIPPYTFAGCSSLKAISIPVNVEEIASKAFLRCKGLEEVIIMNANINVSLYAYEYKYDGWWKNIKNTNIKINLSAFDGCSNVRKITTPNFNENMLFTIFQPLKNLLCIKDEEGGEILVDTVKCSKAIDFRLYSMFYHSMGMNITKVRGECTRRKTYKEPVKESGFEINKLYSSEQDVSVILREDWLHVSGIGLVLGWNDYRAIDVDNFGKFYDDAHIPQHMNSVIDIFLRTLGLPSDYQWIVKSGSQKGFHIIIKVRDFGETDDEYIAYAYSAVRDFERIEFRFKDHLMLPPSIHASGHTYSFYHDKMPSSIPSYVKISSINQLLEDYCGGNCYSKFKWNGREVELVEFVKAKSTSSHNGTIEEYGEDSIQWLEACDSPHCYNSLAIRYAMGKSVQVDSMKAYELFLKANNSQAFFNLASLISVGFFQGTIQDVNGYLEKIDIHQLKWDKEYDGYYYNDEMSLPQNKIAYIRKQAIRYVQNQKLFLFFDTETTGVPNDYNAPSSDTDNWPRLVQIAWILENESGVIIDSGNVLIQPNGFIIPNDAVSVHGITTEKALNKGVRLEIAIRDFQSNLDVATYIVGHNIEFDKKILGAEMIRLGVKDVMDTKKSLCTMQSSIDFCKIPGKYGYKYPKLQELYKKLFGSEFDNAHDAMSDIEATEKCFWEMRRRNLI